MTQLKRQLSTRHLCMIALGSSLGTGIFLTSGSAIYLAGPGGALLAYIIMGAMVYLLMNSLGEMAAYRPITGSMCQYASDYVSKPFGFAMGYNYWFNWAITIAIELIAAAIVMSYWFPHVNPIIWCVLFFTAILFLNILPVKNYGETEYWLSLLKIMAIIIFIGIGIAVICGFNASHHVYGWHNWITGDAPFHHGMGGLLEVFILSGFSFQGTEVVGITAGECKDPQRSIPKAIQQIFWRILIFYILTMVIISFLIPYTDPRLLNVNSNVALSPFTLILAKTGLHSIASVMNFIILLALLSACNSDMYSSTRILWHLADVKSAPKLFARTNRFGVPIFALIASAAFGLLGLLCNDLGSSYVFLCLVNISSLAGFVAWFGIAISHYNFRKIYLAAGNQLADLPFKARFYPAGPLLAMGMCLFIIAGQAFLLLQQGDMSVRALLSTYLGLPIIIILWFSNKIYRYRKA